jgi:hypothetical protein
MNAKPRYIPRVPARDEARARAEHEQHRVERPFVRTGEAALMLGLHLGGRRGLALGEAVDPVVHHRVGEVHVAADRVRDVTEADAEAVAVAAHHHGGELGA